MKVVEIISRAGRLLNDELDVHWTRLELQQWLNDSYTAITAIIPGASSMRATMTLTAGAAQAPGIPGLISVIGVLRTTAATSTKKAISSINRAVLDSLVPGWEAMPQSVDIKHWVPDTVSPDRFSVYPPATSAASVEIVYSFVPIAHALSEADLGNQATAELTRINDVFVPAIVDYILYRAHSKSATAADAQKAAGYYTTFRAGLGNSGAAPA